MTVRNVPSRFDMSLGNFDRFRSEQPHLALPPLPYLPYLPYTTSPTPSYPIPPYLFQTTHLSFCELGIIKLPQPIRSRQSGVTMLHSVMG